MVLYFYKTWIVNTRTSLSNVFLRLQHSQRHVLVIHMMLWMSFDELRLHLDRGAESRAAFPQSTASDLSPAPLQR